MAAAAPSFDSPSALEPSTRGATGAPTDARAPGVAIAPRFREGPRGSFALNISAGGPAYAHHHRFLAAAASDLERAAPSHRVVSSESDDDVPEVSHPSQPKAAVPRGAVVAVDGDDLRGVLEAEAGGFATFDDYPSGLYDRRAPSNPRSTSIMKKTSPQIQNSS